VVGFQVIDHGGRIGTPCRIGAVEDYVGHVRNCVLISQLCAGCNRPEGAWPGTPQSWAVASGVVTAVWPGGRARIRSVPSPDVIILALPGSGIGERLEFGGDPGGFGRPDPLEDLQRLGLIPRAADLPGKSRACWWPDLRDRGYPATWCRSR